MTNQERNIRLAELLGYKLITTHKSAICIDKGVKHYQTNFNPCEDWGDLMPLVVEHKINLRTCVDMNTWFAYIVPTVDDINDVHNMRCDVDPQIALVDCLISLLESKQLNPTQR